MHIYIYTSIKIETLDLKLMEVIHQLELEGHHLVQPQDISICQICQLEGHHSTAVYPHKMLGFAQDFQGFLVLSGHLSSTIIHNL